jgi:hypothetical protein
MTHMRVVEDSVNIFVWFMLPDVKQEFLDQLADFYSNIDF